MRFVFCECGVHKCVVSVVCVYVLVCLSVCLCRSVCESVMTDTFHGMKLERRQRDTQEDLIEMYRGLFIVCEQALKRLKARAKSRVGSLF